MKAFSLWQPWASLWCSPAKIHETRHWAFNYRGKLVVHAAKKFVRDVDPALEDILDSQFGHHWGQDLPVGALIGVVEVTACRRITERADDGWCTDDGRRRDPFDLVCGDFTPGRYAIQRGSFRTFKTPIPYRGRQGLFQVPDELVWDAP